MRTLHYEKTIIKGPNAGTTTYERIQCPFPAAERYAKKQLSQFTQDSPGTDAMGAVFTVQNLRFTKEQK